MASPYTDVDDFEEYTGAHGFIKIGGVTWADVEYDVKWSRSLVTHSRASKFSDIQLPGKLTVKTTIRKVLVHAEAAQLMGWSITDEDVSGTAETLLAASHVLDATDWYEDMTDPTIATPSRIRYTLQTNNLSVAGTITVIGTDSNGNAQAEILNVPATMLIGGTITTSKLFATVAGHTIRAIDSASDLGTFAVASVAGGASYTVHNPKLFQLEGGVLKSGKSITIKQPDCWFSDGGMSFVDAGQVLEVNAAVEMHDPDLLEITVVNS